MLGRHAPASWPRIAHRLVVLYDPRRRINPEFTGCRGPMVKQADATMLLYPWGHAPGRRNLDYYVPRTDPAGPSMSDAVSAVDTWARPARQRTVSAG